METDISAALISMSSAMRMETVSALLFNRGMEPVNQTRRKRLRMLEEEAGGVEKLAIVIRKSGSQVSQWLNASTDFKTGKPRGMLGATARQIELACHKPNGWMDQPIEAPGVAVALPSRGFSASDNFVIDRMNAAGSMGPGIESPEHDQVIDQITLTGNWIRGRLPGISNPAKLKVISAYGNSMAPTFNDGDLLLVDTGIQAVDVDGVYVLRAHGRLFIKTVKQRLGSGAYSVSSDNNPSGDPPEELSGKYEIECKGRVVWAWNGRKL